MGRIPRPRPDHLAVKLLLIRLRLGLSQKGMIRRLNYHASPLYSSSLSEFEKGVREPPLPLLLRYARLADIPMEVLVDDDLDLPAKLNDEHSGQEEMRPKCPACHSIKNQIKDGHNPGGFQRYLCRVCGRNYTPEAPV